MPMSQSAVCFPFVMANDYTENEPRLKAGSMLKRVGFIAASFANRCMTEHHRDFGFTSFARISASASLLSSSTHRNP